MKLYYLPGACSLASHIVLEWIGRPYLAQKMGRDDLKSDAYLALNPAGAVPVLEVDGWALTQNAAILNYLTDAFPEVGLGGDGTPRARAEINRWLGFLNADVHPAFKPLFGSTRYLEDDAVVERTQTHARATLRRLFERADAQLSTHEWLAGPRSVVDPYLFAITRWTHAKEVDLDGLRHLRAWFERMGEDASVRRALEQEGLT
ncbi:glutathione S-transferase family protein [Oleiagrimonas soli]|uniref:Glutathione S-transferase n=1 Tax=Oleiagrimonas soli TaxID=1543381 RepID=A0A099CU93_9GAMM|nr:glutathione S-transferase N-terminal domain-containing protein [Oleiagrimonas soli]KGI77364.1 glutathione S-transferase [Oleiagrimonas soli]MBB6182710.1 glutathione S-transferase [Oleiagrimonas soli]